MEIQLSLLHIGMQLNGAKDAFYAERKEQHPDPEMLGQLVEDFRDKLDNRLRSLRSALRLMEENLELMEFSEA